MITLSKAACKKYQDRKAQNMIAYEGQSPNPEVLETKANMEILDKAGTSPPSYQDVVANYATVPEPRVVEKKFDSDHDDGDESDIDEEGFDQLIAHVRARHSSARADPAVVVQQSESHGCRGRCERGGCGTKRRLARQSRCQQKKAARAARRAEKWAARAAESRMQM